MSPQLAPWLLDDAATRLAQALIHFLWQGSLIGLVAAAALQLMSRSSAALRHALCLTALASLAATPPATFLALAPNRDANRDAAAPAALAQAQGPAPIDLAPRQARDAEPARIDESKSRLTPDPTASPDAGTSPAVPATVQEPIRTSPAWLAQAQPWLLGAWLAGVAALALRRVSGCVELRRLRRTAQRLDGPWARHAARLARRMGLSSGEVRASQHVAEALAMGLIRPLVLLPAPWLATMDPRCIEAVIAHELAHLRRADLWVIHAQRCLEALLFYHPVVWWLSRRLDAERELCCDELAVRVTRRPADYAHALETVAIRRLASRGPVIAAGIGGPAMSLLHRVRHVLGMGRAPAPQPAPWTQFAVLSATALLAILFLTSAAPAEDRPRDGGPRAAGPEGERRGPPPREARDRRQPDDAGPRPQLSEDAREALEDAEKALRASRAAAEKSDWAQVEKLLAEALEDLEEERVMDAPIAREVARHLFHALEEQGKRDAMATLHKKLEAHRPREGGPRGPYRVPGADEPSDDDQPRRRPPHREEGDDDRGPQMRREGDGPRPPFPGDRRPPHRDEGDDDRGPQMRREGDGPRPPFPGDRRPPHREEGDDDRGPQMRREGGDRERDLVDRLERMQREIESLRQELMQMRRERGEPRRDAGEERGRPPEGDRPSPRGDRPRGEGPRA